MRRCFMTGLFFQPKVGSQSLCEPGKEKSVGSEANKVKVARKKSSVGKPKQPKRKRVTSPKNTAEVMTFSHLKLIQILAFLLSSFF